MEPVVKVTCDCGDIELHPSDLTLLLNSDTQEDFYSFVCPECGTTMRRLANERVTEVLLAVGVIYKNMQAPITEVEIKEFVRQLQKL